MIDFGPFSVSPEQIVALRKNFTGFVNKLLAVEVASGNARGVSLLTTFMDTVADGGVDAHISGSSKSQHIPDGLSAWQFKQGDLLPGKAAEELKNAKWACELISQGAKYRLVVGAALSGQQITNRRKALVDQAKALGLPVKDVFEVIDANQLARWTEDFPSLAVAGVLGGPGTIAVDCERWAGSNEYQHIWSPDDARKAFVDQLLGALKEPDVVAIRIDGVGGVGKTKLALEALKESPLAPLVAYVADGANLVGSYANHLLVQNRLAIVVVDECSREMHRRLAKQLPVASRVKLLTIGKPDADLPPTRMIALATMDEDAILTILNNNGILWPEARRFVADLSQGNPEYALWIAARVGMDATLTPATLVTELQMRDIVERGLPDGSHFLAACALALLTRIGWDGELAPELDVLAGALDLSSDVLRDTGRELERSGLLERQGRYRAVTPHPVAVSLAIAAWEEFGPHIVERLLPRLGPEQARSLLERVTEIGDLPATKTALAGLLSSDGPFATLEALETSGPLLSEVAVVLPDRTLDRLQRLVGQASPDELRERVSVRRHLVRSLIRLVWHARLFEPSADLLLRLALAENEHWANNATGIWISLFGAVLPASAAGPKQRAAYLAARITSDDPKQLTLAARAAAAGLQPSESIMVDGELQGGVLVERRGQPESPEAFFEYRDDVIAILSRLASNDEREVSAAAQNELFAALHPVLDSPQTLTSLINAILAIDDPQVMRRLRNAAEDLGALFERAEEINDGRPAGLAFLRSLLPAPTPSERLNVLAHAKRWDFADGQLQTEIDSLLSRNHDLVPVALSLLLQTPRLPAAFELGRGLTNVVPDLLEDGERVSLLAAANLPALVGFLWGLHEGGAADIFDSFLDTGAGKRLPSEVRLDIAVRGPISDAGISRALLLLPTISPAVGAASLFGWHGKLPEEVRRTLLELWLPRIQSQVDYNAVIDFTNMLVHDESSIPAILDEVILALLQLRLTHPNLANEMWDWARLANRAREQHAEALVTLLLQGIEDGSIRAFPRDEDHELLLRCLLDDFPQLWPTLAAKVLEGDWRLGMTLRDVADDSWPIAFLQEWVGTDVDRAALLAHATIVPGDAPSALVRLLLERFPDESRVQGGLYGNFVSGGWSGNESDRIGRQIRQLQGWKNDPKASIALSQWADTVIQQLEVNRQAALQREAERGF